MTIRIGGVPDQHEQGFPTWEAFLQSRQTHVTDLVLDSLGNRSAADLLPFLSSTKDHLAPGGTLVVHETPARFSKALVVGLLQTVGYVSMTHQALDPTMAVDESGRPVTEPRFLVVAQKDDGERPTMDVRGDSPDTLVVLPTTGKTWHLARACVTRLREVAAVPFDLFLVFDAPESSDQMLEAHRFVDDGMLPTRWDVSPTRRGLVPAYNVGYQHFLAGKWKYLHLLEDGVTVVPGWDLDLRRALRGHPGFGWVACGQIEHPTAPFTSLCSLMTREAAEKVQGLDPIFAPEHFDDGDLFLRLRQHGFCPVAIPTKVHHPEGRTSRTRTLEEDIQRMREKQQLFYQRWNLPDFPWSQVAVHEQAGCPRCGER